MMARLAKALARRWSRATLKHQVALIYTLTTLIAAFIIVLGANLWGQYAVQERVSTLSAPARHAFAEIAAGRQPDAQELLALQAEARPIQTQIGIETDIVTYSLILVTAIVMFLIGKVLLGRVGHALDNLGDTARQIAQGDLTVRATLRSGSSREEAELICDFNAMASALERAERELAESTAAIAHELRTPLTILNGRLHGIIDGVFAAEPAEVSGLLLQVQGLIRLVEDLQTLSLANSRGLVLTLAKTDLVEEVERVLAVTGPDLVAAGLDVVTVLAPAPLQADGMRVRQVIGAVLANACRYAPHSGVLRIETRSTGPHVLLEITDHGPGLPDNVGNRAFDRFWRGEVSRNRNTGGTGLGLAVVRAIVEAHHGTARLANHAGGGVCFAMTLPTGA